MKKAIKGLIIALTMLFFTLIAVIIKKERQRAEWQTVGEQCLSIAQTTIKQCKAYKTALDSCQKRLFYPKQP